MCDDPVAGAVVPGKQCNLTVFQQVFGGKVDSFEVSGPSYEIHHLYEEEPF